MFDKAKKTSKGKKLIIASIVWVPGSMGKSLALKRLLSQPQIDGVVVLGVIEKGVTKAIIYLQLEIMKPVGMGILGPEIGKHQIQSRLKPYAQNAVNAVAEMLQHL